MTEPETPSNHRVLIVEDDIFLADMICQKFREHAFVFHAGSVHQAEEILAKETVDLICLDVQLPGEDGIAFLTKIKADEKWKQVPVLMISNLSSESDIKRAKDAGANDYIVKSNVELSEIVKRGLALLEGK